jgi:hypothetical protein
LVKADEEAIEGQRVSGGNLRGEDAKGDFVFFEE